MFRTAPVRRSRSRLIVTCAAAAGVAIGVQGCGGSFAHGEPGSSRRAAPVAFLPPPEPAAPVSSAALPPAAPPGVPSAAGAGILRGERQVLVLPVKNEATLAVAGAGHLRLSDTFGDAALFVLTPTAGKHQIRTAKLRRGGEALCVSVRRNGPHPLTLTTASCDAAAPTQLFAITAAGDAWTIAAAGGAYVRVSAASGVIVEETGDGPAPTAFRLVDRGPATLPALD